MKRHRHVTRVSEDASREITRDYPTSRQYDSVTFDGDQVRHMAARARSRGKAAAADELARAADEAAKTPTGQVAFLRFFH